MIRFCFSLFLLFGVFANAGAQGLSPLALFSGETGTADARNLMFAADGQHLFSVGSDAEGPFIASFAVEASTGNLTLADSERPEDCEFTTGSGLSNDGRLLFYSCSSSTARTIGALRVDPDTGNLSLISNNLIQVSRDSRLRSLVISPDSRNLYVAGYLSADQPGGPGNFLNVYELEPVDGDLVQIQTIGDETLEGRPVSDVFLSPNGRHFYVQQVRSFGGATLLFDRDTGGFLANGRELRSGAFWGRPVFTNGGSRLYVSARVLSSPPISFIDYMQRDINTGELTLLQSDFDPTLFGTTMVSAAEGRLLYHITGGIRAYQTSPVNGEYSLVRTNLNAGFADILGSGFRSVVVSPDEQRLYASFESGIAMFGIEGLPVPPATPVPGLTQVGLFILILLLFAGGAVMHRQSAPVRYYTR